MDINTFVSNFALQFDDTDPNTFTMDTAFKELDEWSSLIALSVIAMSDEEYNVKLSGDDIRSSSTVSDLYNLIKSRQ